MNCAITGAVPEHPVVSRKSGAIFERRNIEDYISQNGTDPVTGEELVVEDLIEIKAPRAVKPRPATLTSVPSLLQAFQNEWDALALESYNLKQQLAQARQQLATVLYEHETSTNVIEQLTKERDEARDALSNITVTDASNGHGEEMAVDAQPMPDSVIQMIEEKAKELAGGRRKRPIPDGWSTAADIQAYKPKDIQEAAVPGSRALAADRTGNVVVFGGKDGVVVVYSVAENKTIISIRCGPGTVRDAIFWDTRPVVALSTGEVKVFEADGAEVANVKVHAGSCNGLALHPTGGMLASVGDDKNYVVQELATMKTITRVSTESALTCAHFHPDGKLFGVGGSDGSLKIFDITSGTAMAGFETTGALRSVTFSENGTLLASVSAGAQEVAVYDLRKGNLLTSIKTSADIFHTKWDYTGQFLAIASAGSVSVEEYNKKAKSFTTLFSTAIPSMDVAWGALAKALVVLKSDGYLVSLH